MVAQVIENGVVLPVMENVIQQIVGAIDRALFIRLVTCGNDHFGQIFGTDVALFLRGVEGVGVHVLGGAVGKVYTGGILLGIYPVVDGGDVLAGLTEQLTGDVTARGGGVHLGKKLRGDVVIPFLGIVARGMYVARVDDDVGHRVVEVRHRIKEFHIGLVLGVDVHHFAVEVFFIQRAGLAGVIAGDGNVTEDHVSCIDTVVVQSVHRCGRKRNSREGDHWQYHAENKRERKNAFFHTCLLVYGFEHMSSETHWVRFLLFLGLSNRFFQARLGRISFFCLILL